MLIFVRNLSVIALLYYLYFVCDPVQVRHRHHLTALALDRDRPDFNLYKLVNKSIFLYGLLTLI